MRELIGPPKVASNAFVLERLQQNCCECKDCGHISHYKVAVQKKRSIQAHLGGRVMTVRRGMYMAAFPNKEILKGRRITSKCPNPFCIEPSLLVQATSGQIVSADYKKGNRDKAAVMALLARYTRKLNTKLSDESVRRIREDERTGKYGAHDYGITPEHFNRIKRGAARVGSNPFAGLMA